MERDYSQIMYLKQEVAAKTKMLNLCFDFKNISPSDIEDVAIAISESPAGAWENSTESFKNKWRNAAAIGIKKLADILVKKENA